MSEYKVLRSPRIRKSNVNYLVKFSKVSVSSVNVSLVQENIGLAKTVENI